MGSTNNFSLPADVNPGDVTGSEMDIETILRLLGNIVSTAKTVPLSSSVLIPREEVLDLLDMALTKLPPEIKRAQWMLKEREEFLDGVKLEGHEILEAARTRAERLVSKTEIVRQANSVASHLVQGAREEAARLRHEAEDYADQKLANFEIVLNNTLKSVRAGRAKLMPPAETNDEVMSFAPPGENVTRAEAVFFDQDR